MKKRLLPFLSCVICLLVPGSSEAQTVAKGAWMIGGTASFSSIKYKTRENSTSVIEISPTLGLYVIDNLAIGLGIGLLHSTPNGLTTNLIPFVRFYMVDRLFLQAGYGLGLNKDSGSNFLASIGYSGFLNDHLALEPQLYFLSNNDERDFRDYSAFGLAISLQAFLGRKEV